MRILLARSGANLYNKNVMNKKSRLLFFVFLFTALIKTGWSAEDLSGKADIFDDIKVRMVSSVEENVRLAAENKALKAELIDLQLEVEQHEQDIEALDPGYRKARKAAREQTQVFSGRDDPRGDELIQEAQNIYLSGRSMALGDVQRLRELHLYDLQYQKQELELDLKSLEFLDRKVGEQRRPELNALEREVEENAARTRTISEKIAEEEQAALRYPQTIDLLKMENEALKQKISQLKQWKK